MNEVYDIAALIGITVGVVTAIRTGVNFNTKWTPLIAIIVGTALTFAWGVRSDELYDSPQAIADGILTGVALVGFGAIGVVSGTKNVSEAIQERRNTLVGYRLPDRFIDDFGNPVVPEIDDDVE